jgi:glycosyltransferase involved in cell wall biosynthesis
MSTKRLSVCYLVPGHDLVATVGPTRNVLSLARSLERHADVTVAFRRVSKADAPAGMRVLEIEPAADTAKVDDSAMRGVSFAEFLSFMRKLNRLTDERLGEFDVILEKSWLLSGYVSRRCLRRGQLGVPVENIVPDPVRAARGNIMKRLRLTVADQIAGQSIRHAPLVLAETEFLKRELAAYWHIAAERIAVVDLGVDRALFRPHDQASARRARGMDTTQAVFVYVGVLDYTHDLEPVMRALGAARRPDVELHVIGDGQRAEEYRRIASETGARVTFHGRCAHGEVPGWIATADLCLAPYDARAFASGELGYATMKIPEYLAVGRAVASVASGRVASLVRDGETGFLFQNDVDHWARFLLAPPSRERLAAMGAAAAATRLQSWDDTADAYHALCAAELARFRLGRS